MVIPGISIACFTAQSASSFPFKQMHAETYIECSVFPGYGVLQVCQISVLILDGFLCCFRGRALNLASLYILPTSCPLFFYISHCYLFLSFQLCGRMFPYYYCCKKCCFLSLSFPVCVSPTNISLAQNITQIRLS